MNLLDKIKKIEAIIASSKSDGEKQAAALAKSRLLERHEEEKASKPVEYTVPLGNHWRKKLFIALCQKYQIRPYRYKRQKYTTVMIRADSSLVENILTPEFNKYAAMLEELAEEILGDIISQIHNVKEEEIVIMGELPQAP